MSKRLVVTLALFAVLIIVPVAVIAVVARLPATRSLFAEKIADPRLVADDSEYIDDYVRATGTIANKGNATADDVRVTITVFDGATPIGTTTHSLGAIPPGEQRSYDVRIDLSSTPESVQTDVSWDWLTEKCPPGSSPSPDPSDPDSEWCLDAAATSS